MTTAAAVDLAQRGLAVFPLPPGGRRPTSGGWSACCLTDPALVRQLWRDGDNIGVSCRASRIVALDLDVDGNGNAVLSALARRLNEPWPDTLTVSTPSGGQHLYFAVPENCSIGSSSGGHTQLGPGIDVRGPGRRSGGYLIGPGSVVGDIPYRITHDAPLAPLPTWMAARLAPAA